MTCDILHLAEKDKVMLVKLIQKYGFGTNIKKSEVALEKRSSYSVV